LPAADVLSQSEAQHVNHRLFRVALTLDEIAILKQCIDKQDPAAFVEASKFFELDESDLSKLLDGPFTPKPVDGGKPFPERRFSNGDYGVFYSAHEQETAGVEYAHYAPKYVPENVGTVQLRLHLISAQINGTLKDVRSLTVTHPELIVDAHDFCHEVGALAVAQGTDGLLAASVRRVGGTNAAIFKRGCLSDPQKSGTVICEVNAAAKTATCKIEAAP
jgi:hypothetical protein